MLPSPPPPPRRPSDLGDWGIPRLLPRTATLMPKYCLAATLMMPANAQAAGTGASLELQQCTRREWGETWGRVHVGVGWGHGCSDTGGHKARAQGCGSA